MAVNPLVEVPEAITEAGADTLNLCYQCGTCTSACPWNLVKDFSPRLLFRQAQLGMEGYEQEALWQCMACHQCVIQCPRGVAIADVIATIRHLIGASGLIPATLRAMLGSVKSFGNPWSGEAQDRTAWAKDLEVPRFGEGMDTLYYPCCTPAYDSRSRGSAKATVNLLREAGESFGILGSEEVCCGISMREVGDYELFDRLVRTNIRNFKQAGVRSIMVQSPHCLEAFTKLYPAQGGSFEVEHYTEWLDRAIEAGRITPQTVLAGKKVAYHDSCYLGRRNGVYDPPRRVLQALGAELVEFDRNREQGLCCGGGGGRMWMETPQNERFADMRVREAVDKGVDIIAVACPYCYGMYADALITLPADTLELHDIAELVSGSLD